ncbi:MAG: hypothetical protein AAGG38_06145 [Planctomycetota bacterium]
MPHPFKLTALVAALVFGSWGCSSSNNGSSGSSASPSSETDPDKRRVQDARAAWPEYTGDSDETIDLASYNTVTLIPFTNLTDNSEEDDAGSEFVEEIQETLEDRYEGKFTQVRVAEAPLGETDEVVVRGQVYDFSSGSGWNPWTGRNKAKFKAEFVLENGASGELLKSGRIRESGYGDNDEQLEDAGRDLAKMIARSKS